MSTATELAALTERLANHIDYVEKSMREAHAERQLATAERQVIIEQIKSLRRDMEEVKPVTSMVNSLRAKITGGLIVLGFIGAVAWTAVLFFKEAIVKFLIG